MDKVHPPANAVCRPFNESARTPTDVAPYWQRCNLNACFQTALVWTFYTTLMNTSRFVNWVYKCLMQLKTLSPIPLSPSPAFLFSANLGFNVVRLRCPFKCELKDPKIPHRSCHLFRLPPNNLIHTKWDWLSAGCSETR